MKALLRSLVVITALLLSLILPVAGVPVAAAASVQQPVITFGGQLDGNTLTVHVSAVGSARLSSLFFALRYDTALLTLCSADGAAPAELSDCITPSEQFRLIEINHDAALGCVGAELVAYPSAVELSASETPAATLRFAVSDPTALSDTFFLSLCTAETDRDFLAGFATDHSTYGGAYFKVDTGILSVGTDTLASRFAPYGDEPVVSVATISTALETAAPTTVTTTTIPADIDIDITRMGGDSRLETAVLVCQKGWYCSDTVILANAMQFQDALAGVPLAAAFDAPILLTTGNSLETVLIAELRRIGSKNIYILGGYSSINRFSENTLRAYGMTVFRISGDNRYATSVQIAQTLSDNKKGGSFSELFFLNSDNFADALSVSAVAAINGSPILYIPGNGALPEVTADFVKATGCTTATVIGGTGAVSDAGFDSIKALCPNIKRISGNDRYDTALEVCSSYERLFTGDGVVLATGTNFPDALAGAALAARFKSPVVLVDSATNARLRAFIIRRDPQSVYILGGRGAIADETVYSLLGI